VLSKVTRLVSMNFLALMTPLITTHSSAGFVELEVDVALLKKVKLYYMIVIQFSQVILIVHY